MMLTEDEIAEARTVITRALEEDLRYGPDITTLATVPADAWTTASVVAREPGVIAGSDLALMVFDEVLGVGGYRVKHRVPDGTRLDAGGAALTVHAPTRGLLTAERTVLHAMFHLSGIAPTTAAWVDAVAGLGPQISDTPQSLTCQRCVPTYAAPVPRADTHP